MIKIEDLSKVFRTGDTETIALKDINLEIREGEFVAIMGPSGCGKTSLLNIIGLLDTPSDGNILLWGKNATGLTEYKRTKMRKGKISFVFQSFNLIDELSVYENTELPLLYMNIPASERKERTEKALEEVKMLHRKKHLPQQLSGGQQQRVAVARAIVTKPQIILADEPTGNLDSSNGENVMTLLSELNKNGATIIMATHSASDADMAHRVIQLFDGFIVTENIRRG